MKRRSTPSTGGQAQSSRGIGKLGLDCLEFRLHPVIALFISLVLICWSSTPQAADYFNGQKLYQQYCIDCHGPAGRGTLPGAPDFSRGEGLFQTDTQIMRHIRQGSARAPGFGNSLSEREMLDIIAYLRGFR